MFLEEAHKQKYVVEDRREHEEDEVNQDVQKIEGATVIDPEVGMYVIQSTVIPIRNNGIAHRQNARIPAVKCRN